MWHVASRPLYAARGALYGMQLLRRDIETKRLLRNTEQLELALDDQQLVHVALRQQVSPPPHSAPGKASERNTAGARQQSSCRRFAAYSARAIARLVRCKRFTWASASRVLRRSPRGQRQRHVIRRSSCSQRRVCAYLHRCETSLMTHSQRARQGNAQHAAPRNVQRRNVHTQRTPLRPTGQAEQECGSPCRLRMRARSFGRCCANATSRRPNWPASSRGRSRCDRLCPMGEYSKVL